MDGIFSKILLYLFPEDVVYLTKGFVMIMLPVAHRELIDLLYLYCRIKSDQRISENMSTVTFAVIINPLSANPTKWSNTLNCLSVFDHFMVLALKGLRHYYCRDPSSMFAGFPHNTCENIKWSVWWFLNI